MKKYKKIITLFSSISILASVACPIGILSSCSSDNLNDNSNNSVPGGNNSEIQEPTPDNPIEPTPDNPIDPTPDNPIEVVNISNVELDKLCNSIKSLFIPSSTNQFDSAKIINEIKNFFNQLSIAIDNVDLILNQSNTSPDYYNIKITLNNVDKKYELASDCNIAVLNDNELTITFPFYTKNIIDVDSYWKQIYNAINTEFKTIKEFSQLQDSLNTILNNLKTIFGSDCVKNIKFVDNSSLINVDTATFEYKLDIEFYDNYYLSMVGQNDNYSIENNILHLNFLPTNIDANYSNVYDLVNDNFNTLTVDDIKNDISNHTIGQLNFLKLNIDYIQTLLQKITDNSIIYNFFVDNANIIGNLINNIITQSIRQDLNSTRLFEMIFADKKLNEIFKDNNAINGLINLVRYFLPEKADSIIDIINSFKSLPINLIISTIQKLLANKLPKNLIDSLNDLKKSGLLSFVIDHDVDILSLLPTNNVLNDIIQILKLTDLTSFKSTGIIDFMISLLKSNNSVYLKSLLLNLFNSNENSVLGKILNTFIFNNSSLNKDTLSGFFYVFSHPIDNSGNPILYKDFLNSIQVSENFRYANYSMSSNFLDLEYDATFRYGMNLNFDITKIYKLFPNFTINLGTIKLNKDFIVKNIPKKITIVSGDYIKYSLSILDNVKYNIKQKFNLNCLSWQAIAHEKYDVNMKHSCEKWYRNTPKSAVVGVAKCLSKYVSGIFYHVWDTDLNYKPDNSILNKFTLPAFKYDSESNGTVKINSNVDLNSIKKQIISTVSDEWVKNSTYEWHAGIEYIKLSQYYTTFNFDINSIVNQLFDLSGYNGEYDVKLNVLTLAKKLNVASFSLPAIRLIEIKIFFPYLVNDGHGNYVNNLSIKILD